MGRRVTLFCFLSLPFPLRGGRTPHWVPLRATIVSWESWGKGHDGKRFWGFLSGQDTGCLEIVLSRAAPRMSPQGRLSRGRLSAPPSGRGRAAKEDDLEGTG